MPCDTRLKPGQTISDRKAEVLSTVETVRKGLISGRVKPKVGPQGAIVFEGLAPVERNDVTDACIYRRLLTTASPLALAEIAKAEKLAGRAVSREAIAAGAHSHDGGRTWHSHKG
jgi:hypothetical protein